MVETMYPKEERLRIRKLVSASRRTGPKAEANFYKKAGQTLDWLKQEINTLDLTSQQRSKMLGAFLIVEGACIHRGMRDKELKHWIELMTSLTRSLEQKYRRKGDKVGLFGVHCIKSLLPLVRKVSVQEEVLLELVPTLALPPALDDYIGRLLIFLIIVHLTFVVMINYGGTYVSALGIALALLMFTVDASLALLYFMFNPVECKEWIKFFFGRKPMTLGDEFKDDINNMTTEEKEDLIKQFEEELAFLKKEYDFTGDGNLALEIELVENMLVKLRKQLK